MSSHDIAASSSSDEPAPGRSARQFKFTLPHIPGSTPWRASNIAAAAFWLTPPLLCLLLYRQGLSAWFQADDFAWLNLRLQIHSWRDLGYALVAPMAQGTTRVWSERAFFLLFSSLFGADALPFRIWVFLTQCANLTLLSAIAWRLTGSRAAGFWAAILWMANNGLALPMVWTSVYNQILCAFFLLCAFWFLLRYIETGRRRDLYWQWALFLAGFGALEINVVYPALAAIYTLACARKYFRSTLALFVPSAIFTVVHIAVAPAPSGAYALHIDGAIPATFFRYGLWALISSQIPGGWEGRLRLLFAAALALALVGFAVRRAFARDWLPVFCLSWFVIVLAPLLPLRDHISDYYVALPAIGLAILGGYGLLYAWRLPAAWKAASILLAAAYIGPMVRVDRRTVRWWRDRSISVERMVLGVERAHELHPGKAILLDGVTSTLFWAGVFHRPFAIVGVPDVYLTPGSEDRIESHPDQGQAVDYVLPAGPAFHGLREGRIEVYAIGPDRLKNITSLYAQTVPAQEDLPRRVDAANPLMAYLLGPEWYLLEGGFRWMPRRATLHIGGPRSGSEKLYVKGYCAQAELADGPLPVQVTIDGIALPETVLRTGDAAFHLVFDIPSQLADRRQVEIAVETGRSFRPKGESRDLGLAFGTFEIR